MKPSFDRTLQLLQHTSQRHRRGIIAGAVALMAGFGITAVAVAPLAPDAELLPRRLVLEPLLAADLDSQLEALAAQDLSLIRSDITRATDTPASLLARLGVQDASAASFMRGDSKARTLLAGRGGKMVQVQASAEGGLQELVARFPSSKPELVKSHFTRLTLSRKGPDWVSELESVAYGSQTRLASGTIRNTLFAATDEAGLPDAVASQLAEVFSSEIDFHRELRKGDTFSLVYETLTADGEPVTWNEGAGRVLAAEFINGGKAHHAVWFAAADGRGAYYGLDGQSRRRVFLASPMEFSRVTSGFGMRLNPISLTQRKHVGVDYGAPTGTPVRTVGDGYVDIAGWQNGYGNTVQIRHSNSNSTLYGHLSRVDVKKGQRVEQGQRIGAVGSTGWSTGPHLHFEFRVNGQHQDPLRVAKAADVIPIDPGSRQRFADTVRVVQAKLDVAETLVSSRHIRSE